MVPSVHVLLLAAVVAQLPAVILGLATTQRGQQTSRSRFRSAAALPIYTAGSLSDFHAGCTVLTSSDDTVLEVRRDDSMCPRPQRTGHIPQRAPHAYNRALPHILAISPHRQDRLCPRSLAM